jgi:hypothetical protein
MVDHAKAIYQANLDAVTEAVWAADPDLALDHVSIPHRLMSSEADIVLATPEALASVMTGILDKLQGLGADTYDRHCVEAEFLPGTANMIRGRHLTRILLQGDPVSPCYFSDMVLVRGVDGAWRSISVEAAPSEKDHPLFTLDVIDGRSRALPPVAGRPPATPDPES